jgi:Sulfotransferase domain
MISVDPGNPRGIVWLASYPKSGNTWARVFLFALYNLLLGASMTEVDLNRMVEFGENDRATPYYQRYLKKPLLAASRAEIAELRLRVQADIATANRGVVLVKTHNALIDDAGFPTINRDVSAGAIYIVRNPLDVAISYARFFAVSPDQAIEHMAEAGFATQTNADDVYFVTGSWSEHVHSWTQRSHPALLIVRYEDMLEKPGPTFTAMAQHVMLMRDRALLDKAIDLSEFPRLQSSELAHGFPEKPEQATLFFREGRAGQWRDVLTDRQIQRVVDNHGAEMQRFGYLPA